MPINLSTHVGQYVHLGLQIGSIGKIGYGRVEIEDDSFFLHDALLWDTSDDNKFQFYARMLYRSREKAATLDSYQISPQHVAFIRDISDEVVDLEKYVSAAEKTEVENLKRANPE